MARFKVAVKSRRTSRKPPLAQALLLLSRRIRLVCLRKCALQARQLATAQVRRRDGRACMLLLVKQEPLSEVGLCIVSSASVNTALPG